MRSASASAGRALALLGAFLAVSVVIGLLLAGLALPAAWATGSATRGGAEFFDSLPGELAEPPLSEQSTVLDNQGRPLAHFYDEHRILVPLSKINPVMRKAIVAIEDSRFYQHGGVDPKGLLRAFVSNQVRDKVQGASTLTQQYIKLRILEAATVNGDTAGQSAALNQNYTRKLQEVRMAVSLEKKESKDEILFGYLNIANFGDNTLGIEAASQYFFNGTSAAKLTLPQAALLAGVVQAPESYNPFRHPDAAKNRRDTVLARMHQLGDITDKEYSDAIKTPLGVHKKLANSGCTTAVGSAYFCQYLLNTMAKDPSFSALGKTENDRRNAIKRNGLTIRTTLDQNIQEAAQKALLDKVPADDPSGVGTAAVTVEPGTGKVLAMAQNREFFPGTKASQTEVNYSVDFNLGSGNGFQTGSTFKAFTLATWLAKGKGLYDSVDGSNFDRPYTDFKQCNDQKLHGGVYHVSNSEGHEGGSMTVLDATRNSVNTAFVEMESQLNLCDLVSVAKSLGVHKGHAYDAGDCRVPTTDLPTCMPSLTLGPVDISPLTMATAYAAFAADGKYCKPIAVTSISDRNQKPISGIPTSSCTQAIDSNVAHGVTYALKTVLENGTAGGQGIGRPAAGKTGTTDDSVDTWFVGYTPQRATAVWVGDNPNPGQGKKRESLNGRKIGGHRYGTVFGATIATPIWNKIMKVATDGLPKNDWDKPTGKILSGSSIPVPNVTGDPIDDAKGQLESQGFKVTVGDQVPSDKGPDQVGSTTPGAGSRVAPNSSIVIHPGNGQGGGGDQGNGGQGGGGQGGDQGGGQGGDQGNGIKPPIATKPVATKPVGPTVKPSKSPTR